MVRVIILKVFLILAETAQGAEALIKAMYQFHRVGWTVGLTVDQHQQPGRIRTHAIWSFLHLTYTLVFLTVLNMNYVLYKTFPSSFYCFYCSLLFLLLYCHWCLSHAVDAALKTLHQSDLLMQLWFYWCCSCLYWWSWYYWFCLCFSWWHSLSNCYCYCDYWCLSCFSWCRLWRCFWRCCFCFYRCFFCLYCHFRKTWKCWTQTA